MSDAGSPGDESGDSAGRPDASGPAAVDRHAADLDGAVPDGPAVLVVDNYDSFAYNLVQYVGQFAGLVHVRRNDAVDVAGVRALDPDGVVVSPGPGTPAEAGVSMPLFDALERPMLGVCLGHQALCAVAGATVGHAPRVVHGKASRVAHDGRGIFADLPSPLAVGRYHSLAVERSDLPDELIETAWTVGPAVAAGERDSDDDLDVESDDDLKREADEGPERDADDGPEADRDDDPDGSIVMAVRHRERPHVGVQFHPESVLTADGLAMVEGFVRGLGDGTLGAGATVGQATADREREGGPGARR